MLSRLELLAENIAGLHSRLILLVGAHGSGKTVLLRSFAERKALTVLNLGTGLGKPLLALPSRQRARQAGTEFRNLIQEKADKPFLLLDNLEVLFDATLALYPLELLRRQARTCSVIAAWPGEMHNARLVYANPEYREHRSYSAQGLVTLLIQQ